MCFLCDNQSQKAISIYLEVEKVAMWGTCGLIGQAYPNKPNWKTEELTFQLEDAAYPVNAENKIWWMSFSSGILNDRNGV